MLNTGFITGILFFLSFGVFAPEMNEDIASAFRSGEAKQVSKFFGTNIDLVLLDKEDVYSKSQAELILKEFFSKNKPKAFSIVHTGVSKNGSRFAIGKLQAGTGVFKVTWFIKKDKEVQFIHQLRIEPGDE